LARRRSRLEPEPEAWQIPAAPEVCPLCGRDIPSEQRDEHHLTPKVKGGRVTKHMHRICHRQIHALFSEAELARRYNSVEALLEHEDVRKFVAWVKSKPGDFIERTKRSRRLR
jgi:hypothetical protein